MKKFLVCSIRQARETAEQSEEFGIEDQLHLARLVSVPPRASFPRGARVGVSSVIWQKERLSRCAGREELAERPALT